MTTSHNQNYDPFSDGIHMYNYNIVFKIKTI